MRFSMRMNWPAYLLDRRKGRTDGIHTRRSRHKQAGRKIDLLLGEPVEMEAMNAGDVFAKVVATLAAGAATLAGGSLLAAAPAQAGQISATISIQGAGKVDIVEGSLESGSYTCDRRTNLDERVTVTCPSVRNEELFEAWTWGMLGLHAKPTALLDVDGFWQPLLAQLRRMVDDGYLDGRRLDALGVVSDAAELLAFVASYEHPARKWTTPSR